MLIKDLDTLKKYIAVESSVKTILPTTVEAEEQYIIPAIGRELYDALTDGVTNNDLSDDYLELLDKVLQALAPLSYHIGLPELNVRTSDKGLHNSTTQTQERAAKWQFDYMNYNLLRRGMAALDRLFIYLEKSTEKDWYEQWSESEAFTTYKQHIVNRADVMQKIGQAPIANSRWLFLNMLPSMGTVESAFIFPAIGEEFYAELAAAYNPDEEDTVIKKANTLLIKTVSQLTYGLSLRNPAFLQEMIVVTSSTSEQIAALKADLEKFNVLADKHENYANGYLNELKSHLDSNASSTVFATYFLSSYYTPPAVSSNSSFEERRPNNKSANGSFFM